MDQSRKNQLLDIIRMAWEISEQIEGLRLACLELDQDNEFSHTAIDKWSDGSNAVMEELERWLGAMECQSAGLPAYQIVGPT